MVESRRGFSVEISENEFRIREPAIPRSQQKTDSKRTTIISASQKAEFHRYLFRIASRVKHRIFKPRTSALAYTIF